MGSDITYQDIGLIIGEIIIAIILFIITNKIIGLIFDRLKRVARLQRHRKLLNKVEKNLKSTFLFLYFFLALTSFVLNIYIIYLGTSILTYTLSLIETIPPGFWFELNVRLGAIVFFILAARLGIPRIQRLLYYFQEQAKAYEQIKANNESIENFFTALNNIQQTGIWLFIIILAMQYLWLPTELIAVLFLGLKVYLIIVLGRLIATAVTVMVDSIDELGHKYAQGTTYEDAYQRLRSLLQLLDRTLEYIIYVVTASLAIRQISFIAEFADYGGTLVQIIGIIFLSRVLIEIAQLLVDRFTQTKPSKLTDIQWQQRLTLAPLIKSSSKYVIYIAAFLLILRTMEVNTAPILAAIGGIGLIVGLGAQPVINDLVSGIFILFENLYLVGDYIETGQASGVVEAIDVRTTRLRNPDGQLHIIRNGQLGDVVNYSKGYVYAVVEVRIAYKSDMELVYQVIEETGRKFQKTNPHVLNPTRVDGITDFGIAGVVVRTVTKTKPGKHRIVSFLFRKMLKQSFDEAGIEIPFARPEMDFDM